MSDTGRQEPLAHNHRSFPCAVLQGEGYDGKAGGTTHQNGRVLLEKTLPKARTGFGFRLSPGKEGTGTPARVLAIRQEAESHAVGRAAECAQGDEGFSQNISLFARVHTFLSPIQGSAIETFCACRCSAG